MNKFQNNNQSNDKTHITYQGQLKNIFKNYKTAYGSWFFAILISPVALGNVLAWRETSQFSLVIFTLTLVVVLSANFAGNAMHKYCDSVSKKLVHDRHKKVDEEDYSKSMAQICVLLYIMACVSMLGLMYLSPAKIEHLALLFFGGLSASFVYTGAWTPKPYICLRDILIIITFGPIAVLFSYVAQCGQFDVKAILYAIPLALNAEAIFHSEHAKDMVKDRDVGTVTTATVLGHRGSYVFYLFLLFTPYIIFSVMLMKGSFTFVFPLTTLRGAFDLEKCFRKGNLEAMPSRTARLNAYLAIIYILVTF